MPSASTIMPVTQKLLFRVNEACAALGIGRTSFYEEVNAGRLILMRAAGRKLVHRKDLEAYCEARRAESVATKAAVH
jgi:excisionase family DNA binding protein